MEPSSGQRVAIVMLVDAMGRLLMQLRDGHAHVAPNQWSVPGGLIEPGEEAEAAARRELAKETGLRVEGPLTLFWHGTLPSVAQPGTRTESMTVG